MSKDSDSKTQGKSLNNYNLATQYPEVVADWDYALNELPSAFAPFSNKYAHWVCHKCGHKWRTKIINRTHPLTSSGCPQCGKQQSLRTRLTPEPGKSVGDLHPELVDQFHPTMNQGKSLYQVKPSSSEWFWWICLVCHEKYEQMVQRKVGTKKRKGTGCPYCEGKKVGHFNNLAYLYPELADEWAECNDRRANEVLPGSDYRAHWQCSFCNHPWEATVSNRTGLQSGCPRCHLYGVSKWQLQIFDYLRTIFPEAALCAKPLQDSVGDSSKLEADILLSKSKVVIEVDGYLYHRDKVNEDRSKNAAFEKNGYRVLRVRAHPLSKISELDLVVHPHQPIEDFMPHVLRTISKLTGITCSGEGIPLKSVQDLCREYLWEHSLAFKYPSLASEYAESNPIPVDRIMAGSNEIVLWNGKCGHEWPASVSSRTKQGQGCAVCARKVVIWETSLASNFPAVAELWDYSRNGDVTPEQVTSNSGLRFYWICPNGHSSFASVQSKVRPWKRNPESPRYREVNDTKYYYGCKKCYTAYRATTEWSENAKERRHTTYLRKLPYHESLEAVHPGVAALWDYTGNQGLLPSQVRATSSKRVAWVCPKGHQSLAEVREKVASQGRCAECLRENRTSPRRTISPSESLAALYPDIAIQFENGGNAPLTSDSVSPRSGKRAYFMCPKGHLAYVEIKTRVRNGGRCKQCSEVALQSKSSKDRTVS